MTGSLTKTAADITATPEHAFTVLTNELPSGSIGIGCKTLEGLLSARRQVTPE